MCKYLRYVTEDWLTGDIINISQKELNLSIFGLLATGFHRCALVLVPEII